MIDPTADYSSHPQHPAPQVPDFELIRPIGRGGFGQVWLATNRATGHLRAVKVIALGRTGTSDPARREITSITRLEESVHTHHPNLLEIQHVGKTAEHLFYVMEPADDASGDPASADPTYRPAGLESRLESGPLPPEECLRYTRELLGGLAHLHTAGMVHRDVKPANCLFVDGRLKLADFGLLAEDGPQVSRVGTRNYMPPDGRMDVRADVYAAGLVIYELLTGLPVENFPRLGQRARQIAEEPVFRRLNRLMLRACQIQPQQRFGDAEEMLHGLETGHPATADPEKGRRPAYPPRRIVVSAAVVSLALLAAWLWVGWPSRVDVNFITTPYEATIYLDDRPLLDADEIPYTTPCTVEDLPSGVYRVVFKLEGRPNLNAGRIDFSKKREITAQFDLPR